VVVETEAVSRVGFSLHPSRLPQMLRALWQYLSARETPASLNDCFGQAARHSGVAIKPVDSLHALAASIASNTPELGAKSHRVTYDPLAVFMNG
jgi:hypothetical protein